MKNITIKSKRLFSIVITADEFRNSESMRKASTMVMYLWGVHTSELYTGERMIITGTMPPRFDLEQFCEQLDNIIAHE